VKLATWRNAALVLAAICLYQRWQGCAHTDAASDAVPEPAAATTARIAEDPWHPRHAAPAAPALPAAADEAAGGKSFHGFRAPAWALRLLPQPGETRRAYRDRILPLAQLAIAPQRARVARSRDDLAGLEHLDARQLAELDAAAGEAAQAIQARVLSAIAGGELRPAAFKPMTGVAIARDVLGIVDRGNARFLTSLTPDQRTQLASHRFDFADYLLFTARWEDALHVLD
jgi:hypothetical protein